MRKAPPPETSPEHLTARHFYNSRAFRRSLFKCEMQCRGEGEPHRAPGVSPSPPHPHSLSFSPQPSLGRKGNIPRKRSRLLYLGGTVRGSGKRVEGVRGRREKKLGALCGSPSPPHCISHLKRAPKCIQIQKSPRRHD